MHETKCKLIERNGLRCMYCKREVAYSDIQWHHIKPKYVFKAEHQEIDNSYENGSLLCSKCHAMIHKYNWEDSEYQKITSVIVNNKK